MARRGSRGAAGGVLCDLALAKLKSSGLSAEDGAALGLSSLTREDVQAIGPKFPALRSLRIPYWAADGSPLEDVPGGGQFYRLRYLEKPAGFDGVGKVPRYSQAPGTVPAAYFPRGVLPAECGAWPEICRDAERPLIMTEGELKAAKACREGFPTVGLGGVYNWKSPRVGVTWLPSLEAITWVRRNIYVIFDSDLRSNRLVQEALRELAEGLQRRGAFVHVALLPVLKDLEKVGLDDFLVRSGPAALADLLHEGEPLGLCAPLWSINDRFVYVRDPGLVYDEREGRKMAPAAFKDHAHSTEEYHERVLRGDTVTFEPTSAAGAWLRWPMRSEVGRLTYAPGRPAREGDALNVWPGWGCEPRRGSARPFLDLLDHLFVGAEPEALTWFLRWLAYPLQHPGTKLYSAAVIHGVIHGTGKSFVGYTMGRIYGRNFTEIRQSDLHASFNEWAEAKQFVLADDVSGQDRRAEADLLKKMITQRELRVNQKYVPSYVVPDCVNYLFTSNHPDAFFLEDHDRRFFVNEVIVGVLPEKFYRDYERWLDGGGGAAVFHHLLGLDLGEFNPAGPAPRTAAKERMTTAVRSDLAAWVRQLRESPGSLLRVGEVEAGRDLWTAAELLSFYDPERRTGATASGLGRELSRAGVRQVLGGAPLRLAAGAPGRYYAVRRPELWLAAPEAKLLAHVEGSEAGRAGVARGARRAKNY